MMIRYLITLMVLVAGVLLLNEKRYDVVVTGDSILALTDLPDDWYVDTEPKRQPYIRGNEDRMSSQEAVDTFVPLVAPGGTFIFQDNGAETTDEDWRRFLQHLVGQLPDDRCLVGVLPVYYVESDADWAVAQHEETAARAEIMREEVTRQPCHSLVEWDRAVLDDPSLVTDGQHPSPEGVDWLVNHLHGADVFD